MRRVARVAVFEDGSVTLTESVRRPLDAIPPFARGEDDGELRNVLLHVHRFNEHWDESSGGVRLIEGIAIDPEHIVDETVHFEGRQL